MKNLVLAKVHGIFIVMALAITISAANAAAQEQGASGSAVRNAVLVADTSAQASDSNSDQEAISSGSDQHRSTRWERNLRYDGAQLIEVQSGYATACYTPAGSCLLANLVPQGAACWCPGPYGAVWGRAW